MSARRNGGRPTGGHENHPETRVAYAARCPVLPDWVRTIGRTAVGASSASPFVQVTKARWANVQFDRKVLYELDGGDRKEVKKLAIEIEPAAVDVCVPAGSS